MEMEDVSNNSTVLVIPEKIDDGHGHHVHLVATENTSGTDPGIANPTPVSHDVDGAKVVEAHVSINVRFVGEKAKPEIGSDVDVV